MRLPYELQLGWRYTRAGRATRRNGFISFISGVSMLGIALGVAALIIVLSVMNGFQKEVRDRMLGVVSHIEIFSRDGQALQDIGPIMDAARKNPEVIGVAPFITTQALIARGEDMKGATPTTSGFLRAAAMMASMSPSAWPSRERISMWEMTPSMRSVTSFWKPFITESTMISAATPSAMPNIETPEMKEMKPLRRVARPARV